MTFDLFALLDLLTVVYSALTCINVGGSISSRYRATDFAEATKVADTSEYGG